MSLIESWLENRKIEEVTVTISGEGKPADVGLVMLRHKTFGDLVMSSGLEFVSADAGTVTLRGRHENVRKFKRAFDFLDKAGAV